MWVLTFYKLYKWTNLWWLWNKIARFSNFYYNIFRITRHRFTCYLTTWSWWMIMYNECGGMFWERCMRKLTCSLSLKKKWINKWMKKSLNNNFTPLTSYSCCGSSVNLDRDGVFSRRLMKTDEFISISLASLSRSITAWTILIIWNDMPNYQSFPVFW